MRPIYCLTGRTSHKFQLKCTPYCYRSEPSTVLEFHEPSRWLQPDSDFRSSARTTSVRQANETRVSPTFLSGPSRAFAYELETTEEVKTMNFAIDAAIPLRRGCKHQRGRTRRHDVDTRVPKGVRFVRTRTRPMRSTFVSNDIQDAGDLRHYKIENDTEASYRAACWRL
jgi:hypothetical protein